MDRFKKETIKDYTAWDLNCPYVCRKRQTKNKLRTIFKRKARRILKRNIQKEQENEWDMEGH